MKMIDKNVSGQSCIGEMGIVDYMHFPLHSRTNMLETQSG